MAGIGFELKRIFKKGSILSTIEGVGYSSIVTIGPMVMVIGTLLLLYRILEYTSVSYADRELLSSTILYVFIFSLISTSPFNSLLSRYVADKIYEERPQDILPSYYTGLALNLTVCALAGIPFALREIFVGHVAPLFVFTSYCMYISLALVFFNMLYLSATKEYKVVAAAFFIGLLVALLLACLLVFICDVAIIDAILTGMTVGFFLTATLEFAYVRKYFHENSGDYAGVLTYFRRFYKLFFANLFYILGLYVHNFVFWTTPLKILVVKCFQSAPAYDMASCLAMFTSISAMVIFIVQVETKFHERYQKYSESVIGATLRDIQKAKKDMFRMLMQQLTYIVEIQFILSVVVYLLAVIFLPESGFGGLTMLIYPSLAAAYFVIFIMYCNIIFLYYFDDIKGALFTSFLFFIITFLGSLVATGLRSELYGVGAFAGALAAWSFSYFRLRWLEKNFDRHIFCRGRILNRQTEPMPSPLVFDRRNPAPERQEGAAQPQNKPGWKERAALAVSGINLAARVRAYEQLDQRDAREIAQNGRALTRPELLWKRFCDKLNLRGRFRKFCALPFVQKCKQGLLAVWNTKLVLRLRRYDYEGLPDRVEAHIRRIWKTDWKAWLKSRVKSLPRRLFAGGRAMAGKLARRVRKKPAERKERADQKKKPKQDEKDEEERR